MNWHEIEEHEHVHDLPDNLPEPRSWTYGDDSGDEEIPEPNTPVELFNNTGIDIRGMIETAVREAIRNGGVLPDELADVFILRNYNGIRWILEFIP